MHTEIKNIVDLLSKGGTIIYPTDTVWGLGCDATNEEAVQKVFSIKRRSSNTPLVTLLHNENQIFDYVEDVPDIAFDLIEMSETPITIVFEKGKKVAKSILGKDGSIAIRICSNDSCSELLKRWKRPLVSTSVNISGLTPAQTTQGMDPQILSKVDAVYRPEYIINETKPSKIIRINNDGTFTIIRK